VIGKVMRHAQFPHLQLKWRIKLTVWRAVRHTVIVSRSLLPTYVFSNHGAPPKVFHSELFH
jgi:hypothetical protein